MLGRPFHLGKIQLVYLILAFAAAVLGLVLTFLLKSETETPYYNVQLAASERMQTAEEILLQALLDEGIEIEGDDINRTGLIGPEFTALTTTPGTLEAKRTVLNPNFAALFVKYYVEAGLSEGDVVAFGLSGSFPGLALAALCAANEMNLEVRVIVSFGASMHGATRPEFTIPKMYRILKEAGLVEYTMLAVSPGGNDDHGESALYDDSRDIIKALAEEEGVEFIDLIPPDIVASIQRRLELYGDDVDIFVNVGGASPNSGTSTYTLTFPNGLVTNPPKIPSVADRGLMFEYAVRGIPVVNMLNVRKLAADNGLPYDPIPLPLPGSGDVYYNTTYNRVIILATLLVVASLMAVGLKTGAVAQPK